MIQRIYPQEEERWYITERKYLLILLREKDPAANAMTPSEFARNIWLVEDERELWRIHTDEDSNGSPFHRLNQRDQDYVAYRGSAIRRNNTIWRINMNTGQGTLVPKEEARFPSPEGPDLFIRTEQRIYLPDHSYLLLPLAPGLNSEKRNITRVSADGKEMWRIRATSDGEPTYVYGMIYIYKDGTFVAGVDERLQFELDVETGIATPRYFPPGI